MIRLLKPEPMQRVLIVSSRTHQATVIETLHDLQAAHLVEFHEKNEGELAGLRIGRPLPHGEAASERLVRIRALLRHLSLEKTSATRTLSTHELEAGMDATLDRIEAAVAAALEAREAQRNALLEGDELGAKLQPLRSIPLRLEDYRGYEALTSFVGIAGKTLDTDVDAVGGEHLLVRGEGGAFALFVRRADAARYQDALFKTGFSELEVPEGKGTPDERLAEIEAARAGIQALLQKAQDDLQRLAAQHKDFLLAADEHLGIAVEKADAPLSFATSDYAFLAEAWVPTSRIDAVEKALRAATQDNVHFQRLEMGDAHAAHPHGSSADELHGVPERHEEIDAAPPTKYANPGGFRPFQFFTDLFSTPKYSEIDPTVVFAIAFPLFFGFMIGDLGYGLILATIGFLLIRKLGHFEAARGLGSAFLVAGLVAAAAGGILFYDAFGIPFGAHDASGAAEHCEHFYESHGEATWACLLTGHNVEFHAPLPKLTSVSSLLVLSVLVGFVHLTVGLVFGFFNERHHSMKHALAKVGWLFILVGFFIQLMYVARFNKLAAPVWNMMGGWSHPDPIPLLGGLSVFMLAGVAIGGVLLVITEGVIAVLEIPTMLSNILSYMRLGAVAVAKAAMAFAFNKMFLVEMVLLGHSGVVITIVGVVLFLVAQLLILGLGVLSSGIQAIRLNFVEFFTKFYKGGGVPFKPFGRSRVNTTLSTSTP